jgi:hypothetical protein
VVCAVSVVWDCASGAAAGVEAAVTAVAAGATELSGGDAAVPDGAVPVSWPPAAASGISGGATAWPAAAAPSAEAA